MNDFTKGLNKDEYCRSIINDRYYVDSPNIDLNIYRNQYPDYLCHFIYWALKQKFPEIKNLQVLPNNDTGRLVNISFDIGKYAKEEIESYLVELRNMKP